jgi:dTDP-glucose 4,6-dehydratase
MRRTILVTGGAGFIGSSFVRYLLENYNDYAVIVLDALTYAGNGDNFANGIARCPRFTFWYGNVRNPEIVNELVGKADAIVHFAAESHVARSIFDNAVFYETDVLGTHVVANAMVKHPNVERFIHISTSEVYGSAVEEPMTEDHPLNPMSPYASAKAGADRLVYSYWATYGIPAVIIRPFNTYGPRQHLEKAIPRFITSALSEEPLTIHGAGDSARDWVYVSDLCQGIDRALHADLATVKGQVINLGTGRDTTVLEIARMIVDKMGKSRALLTSIGDRPGQVERHIAGTDRARRLLGWEATTSLEEGLDRTIEWYSANPDWWRRLVWMRSVPIKTVRGQVEYH